MINLNTVQSLQTNKQRSWFIRPYREGDEGKLFELYKAVHPEREYNREKWLGWWHWMFKEAPSGSKIWLAEDNGKIVAQYCGIIMNLKVGNDIIKAAFYIDLATHPDYRGQRIYLKLYNTLIDDLAKTAVHIGFGFANDKSYLLGIRRGFLDISAKRKLIRVFKWENLRKTRINNKFFLKLCAVSGSMLNMLVCRAFRAPAIKGLAITQVSRFDERINEFWTRVSSQFPIIVVRSEELLNWRYATVPDISYSIFLAEKAGAVCGYLVLRCFQREYKKVAVIYDLLAESEEVSRCLLSTATKHCRRDGADYIYWVGTANNAYLRTFRKTGFISRPYQGEGKLLVYSSAPNISKEFISDPQNWLIQLGDSDQ